MPHDLQRRHLLRALPLTAAGLLLAAKEGVAQQRPNGSQRVLVAYFTRTGNTEVIARQIRRAQEASLFRIEPATPYPEDYALTVAQARSETQSGYLPPLAQVVADIGRYRTIYLGFPIWGMTVPPVVRSFLRAHDLSGKTVVPFITHGGYGIGNSTEILQSFATGAELAPAFTMEADQERRTLEQVTGWLSRK
ncbi:flavodoxin [Rhizobiales bacterium RZME27]|uniref:Flavodoxin n=1 Tax=Endobacterium cereale TaxID=2663029 RepID=A0A6A8A5Y1_9HYPH|nr:flavodoxin [Endobacterium cereale]MEB2847980.1 flavodoxin [Endobacterium cereale]MQY46685.1 flavodoxin [Endobacterium cereale]